ncbi:hypothetical protein F2Q69_00048163 [Brassica cretica]|uniref:Uncharacterized protein n=1 Tax=Brassica cretica TaxID=69181 RepID=A0A8S9PVZ2_BRACR|nr:hypothetical protein F2Q69_00048163 [Brassica cretica]
MPRSVRGDGQSFEVDEFVIFVGKVERRDGISLSYHLCLVDRVYEASGGAITSSRNLVISSKHEARNRLAASVRGRTASAIRTLGRSQQPSKVRSCLRWWRAFAYQACDEMVLKVSAPALLIYVIVPLLWPRDRDPDEASKAFSARVLRYNRLTLISPRRAISEASSRKETQSSRSPSPLRAISVSRRTRRRAESLGLVGGYIESEAFIFVEESFELSPVLVNISSSVEPISMSLGLDVDEFVTHGDEMPASS